jgi:hypothetical protein
MCSQLARWAARRQRAAATLLVVNPQRPSIRTADEDISATALPFRCRVERQESRRWEAKEE